MKYDIGDTVQTGRFEGCTILGKYYEKEMPYKSWYDVSFENGKHRKVDACEIEPDVLEFNKQAYLKSLEEKRNRK